MDKFYQAIADNLGYDYNDPQVDQYHEDNYCGSAATKGDFAYDLAAAVDGIPEEPWWIRHVDWENAARELELSGDMWCEYIDGEYHYWWSY